ncbi:MAG TPA: Asp-tRNA(Asn)/Glu-tRNA(Gln) amidotransferase subunit GatB, partial [Bacteroidetes bacterium]|nr:Asp-tRNA(Asn)/Glu-tRNA(Gln) amidotransferase subunit GatB [Bacteroidota bacterium]
MKSLQQVLADWEPVIGLEVHAQLKTESKAFCRCRAAYGEEVNTKVCPVCLGYPGTLPVLNREMVTMALKMGLAVAGTIHPRTRFARKNYFYPDLPKGYQITQYETPLITRGWVPLDFAGERSVGITRIHIEEDAGKSHHGGDGTRVDFNRCGVPLIEIVSEPDMRHPAEAMRYLAQIRRIVTYLGICDGNMEEGSLRCDANVSLRRRGERPFGTKVEMKNMNSIHGVERALSYEIRRQAEVLEAGGTIAQETRLWDEAARRTRPMRSKEESHDY